MTRRVLYFGLRYQCPFCWSRLRTLHPFGFRFEVLQAQKVVGGGYRPGVVCPSCESTDRERLVLLFLRSRTDLFDRPYRLLHVAPERRLSELLAAQTNIDYLTADLQMQDAMLRMDLTNVNYPAGSFDAVICNHVLEHIVDDRKAMAELYRILRVGGWALLQVPISLTLTTTLEDPSVTTPAGREATFGQWDHVRIYAKDYSRRLEQAGFVVSPFEWTTDPAQFGGPQNRFSLGLRSRASP